MKTSHQLHPPVCNSRRESSSQRRASFDSNRMVASVCDASSGVVSSRSRRISRDVGRRASRSLSRAIAARSKSRVRGEGDEEEDAAFSKGSRRYTSESVTRSRGRCRPERHRFEASDPSLSFAKRTNSREGNRNVIKMNSKNWAVHPPPPPPRKQVDADRLSDDSPKMNSSLVSADSNHTESTHPSTSYNSSELSLAIVPFGSKQDKALPLPPSPEPRRRHERRTSRGDRDRLTRSQREIKPDDDLDMSTRSESRLARRDQRSLGRSKSRSRRSAPRGGYESSFNESCSVAEEASVAKSRTPRRSRDMNRIDLREVQRSLSRSARRRTSTETECKSTRSKSKGRRPAPPVAHKSRRSSMASTKSKSTRDNSHHDNSSHSIARCYKQIDHHGRNTNANEAQDSASFSQERDRDDARSHRRSMSSVSHKQSPPAPSPRSSSRPRRPRSRSNCEEEHQCNSMEGSDLLSNPATSGDEETPVLNLVIDDTTGCGSFTVPTLYSSITGSVEKHLQLFTVQLNEPSREFFIQTSMGHLHKIREIHPKTNILRTLTYWNGLQKRRYYDSEGHPLGGGQLGISKDDSSNKHEVIMTLVGKYYNRDWENDEDFHIELENFVEDALRFHACLNGLDENEVQEAQKKKKRGKILGSIGSVTGSHMSGSRQNSTSASHEDWMGKKVLCKVLEKITG